MGLALAKHGQITFKNGRPEQDNFDSFVVARIGEAPLDVRTHIVPAGWDVPASGVGEPGLPPVRAGAVQRNLRGDREADSQPADWRSVEGMRGGAPGQSARMAKN